MISKIHCSPFISFVETQVRSCCDFDGLEILIDSEFDFYEISTDIDNIKYGNFTFKGICNVISFLSIICNEENSILLEQFILILQLLIFFFCCVYFLLYFGYLCNLKWGASSRWSFRPNSTWGSIETSTIRKTHPTLQLLKFEFISSNLKKINFELSSQKNFYLKPINGHIFE